MADGSPDTDSELGVVPRGFCPLPWIHLSVNTDTSVRVCCNTDHDGRVKDENGSPVFLENLTSIHDTLNQKTHKDLRKAMLAGERPEFCSRCYRQEDSGGVSVRQIYLQTFSKVYKQAKLATSADGTIVPEVSYVDFSLSNNCNLKCRMCTPYASYGLAKEFDELEVEYSRGAVEKAHTGWDFKGKFGEICREIVPHLKEILTTGGEPFMSSAHLQLLNLCIETGRSHEIVLRYHSNLTLLPPKLVEAWSNFKRVEIHVSLEGVGEVNEYVRYPSKWNTITKHIDELFQLRAEVPIVVEIHSCLQAISWLRLSELLKWVRERSETYVDFFPRIPFPIWVDNPAEMGLLALPPELRVVGIERIERELAGFQPKSPFEESSLQSFRGAIVQLRSAPYSSDLFQLFLKKTKKVDYLRGQDLCQLFPEFSKYEK